MALFSDFSSLYKSIQGRASTVLAFFYKKLQGPCIISNFLLPAPHIEILSDAAKHVEHQSALNLTCVVDAVASEARGGQKWPKMVWYKDGTVSYFFKIIYCSADKQPKTGVFLVKKKNFSHCGLIVAMISGRRHVSEFCTRDCYQFKRAQQQASIVCK